MKCTKRSFASEAAARKSATTTASYQRGTKKRQRPYLCDDCKTYHLATGDWVGRKVKR